VNGYLKATFRSLSTFNFRLWAGGAAVSNVGTWMQRIAQDWLVFTQLTHKDATAMGVVMALQFGPHLLLLPISGFAADHLDRRKLLICTQAFMGLLALGLGIITIAGVVQIWHVYLFAFLLGCVTAFDAPARQTFVSELVGEADLSNAVALNSTSFNAASMIGPAIAGALIAVVGCFAAALAPSSWFFGFALIIVGVSAQTFSTSINSLVQLSTDRAMRGRVMAILFAIFLGCTPFGAPFIGWVADRFGPRWSLGVGAASGFAAMAVGIYYLAKYRHLRVYLVAGRLRFDMDQGDAPPDSDSTEQMVK
jgi:MFS family permease